MGQIFRVLGMWGCLAAVAGAQTQQTATMHSRHAYVGFDRNDYPGDGTLDGLRKDFSFTGYWLNAPPGETASNWSGKRTLLRQKGFGFLVLFNGRLDAQLKGKDAAALGRADADVAGAAASREGFTASSLIFLDQEEGGRLLPEQMAYLLAWVAQVRRSGWRAGIYCSGISVPDGNGGIISTAGDIFRHAGSWQIPLWVARDQCPPSPGCVVQSKPELPNALAIPGALVWQYALSPRRAEFAGGCPKNYAPDNNCYAPGLAPSPQTFLDLNVAESADPSGGR